MTRCPPDAVMIEFEKGREIPVAIALLEQARSSCNMSNGMLHKIEGPSMVICDGNLGACP